MSRIEQTDPEAYVELKTLGEGRSSDIPICPSFSQGAIDRMRPFIAVDGAFTKTIHHYVLMLAVGFDANEHSVILACYGRLVGYLGLRRVAKRVNRSP